MFVDTLEIRKEKIKSITQVPKELVVLGGIRYFIEVLAISDFGNGVEVLARAWTRDNHQIGFGPDGSVDIERFRFFGMPTTVDSVNGEFTQIFTDYDDSNQIVIKTKKFDDNPRQRLLNEIAHTISLKKEKWRGHGIIQGKIGSTTYVYYSSTGGDGYIISSSAVFATVRGAASGTSNDTSANTGSDAPRCILTGGIYYIGRMFTPFDSSAFPDGDTPTSGIYSLYFNSFSGTESTTLEVVQTSQVSTGSLTDTDYNNLTFTSGGSISYPTSTAGYKDITLNATGLSWFSKTAFTMLGAIAGFDLNNSAPTAIRQGSVDLANGTNPPKLTIEVASSTTIKTYNGATTATVKSVLNGTLIANRKTWNGIA